jgi:hypothetical protein
MKKYVVLLAAAIFVLALASPSLAQFKSFGHMEVESYWSNRMLNLNSDRESRDNRQGVAERFRLHFNYGMFEANSQTWGEPAAPGVGNTSPTAGGSTARGYLANRNAMGAYQTDQNSLMIAWAYLDFTVPNTPVTAKVGIFRHVIGGDIGRFWMGNDAPGMQINVNFAPHVIQGFWWKENKQDTLKDNDNDVYGLRYLFSSPTFNVEAWFAYQNDRRTQTEALAWQLVPGSTDTYGVYTKTTARNYDVQPWWLGVSVPMKFGNFSIAPILIYQGGKYQKQNVPGVSDIDYEAYLFDVAATYRVGPGLSFTGEFFYTSGQDKDKPDKMNRFTFPTASESRNVFGNGKSVFMFSNTDLTYYSFKQLDPGGLWYLRLNGEYSPLAWLNLGINYFYLADTSKGAGTSNLVGARTDQHADYVGSEINLIATLKIWENFRYIIGFGYFLPGDVYENADTTPNKKPDPAWNLLSNLRYVF